MKAAKHIGIRLVALGGLFALFNILYTHTLFPYFIEKEADQLGRIWQMQRQDILYFSASDNFGFNDIDSNKSRISTFMAEYYPSLNVGAVDKGAIHAGIFRALAESLPEDSPVQTVILSVNLRSFGPQWINSRLETALQKSKVMYASNPPVLWNRFMVSLNHYDNRSEAERKRLTKEQWRSTFLPLPEPHHTVEAWTAEDKWGGYSDPRRGLADHFIKNFGFVIKEDNPRIQDLDALVEWAKNRQINLVMNVMAENMELADSLVGPDLTGLLESNRDFVINRYQQRGVLMVDNLHAVTDTLFLDRDWPTEHYLQAGRETIARNLAFALRSIHPKDFIDPFATKHLETNDTTRSAGPR